LYYTTIKLLIYLLALIVLELSQTTQNWDINCVLKMP